MAMGGTRGHTGGKGMWSMVLEYPRPRMARTEDQFVVGGISRKDGDL